MISVIIVNRDGEQDLDRCLQSLEASETEILLVDNASRDGSLDLVRDRYPHVRVFPQQENLGFSAANNLAAAKATGEALLLLNADAWLEAGALDLLAKCLAERPGVALVAPRLCYPDGRLQFSWSPARGVLGEALQKMRNPFEAWRLAHGSLARAVARMAGRQWFTAACVLIRADAWCSVGGFDESFFMYFEDVDLCVRLEDAGWWLAYEPRAVVRHAGGVANRKVNQELYRPSQLRYYQLHRPAWETRVLECRLRRRFGERAVERWSADGNGR
jgi:N-acetylglucosaminyl-diphospho-decaprenol L-rhamnosyltransferase